MQTWTATIDGQVVVFEQKGFTFGPGARPAATVFWWATLEDGRRCLCNGAEVPDGSTACASLEGRKEIAQSVVRGGTVQQAVERAVAMALRDCR